MGEWEEKMIAGTRSGRTRFRRAALLGFFAVLCLQGCGQKKEKSGTPEVDTVSLDPDEMTITSEDESTRTVQGISSVLPVFTTSTGTPAEGMEKLNEILESARNDYAVDLSSDRKLMMTHTDVTSGSQVLQITYYQTEYTTSLTGKIEKKRNLCSLAYDIRSDEAITPVEALESTGMTGIELSQLVSDDFSQLGEEGELHSTDMQGFLLDEDGNVTKIYMKLETDRDEDEYEEEFFVVDPKTGTMSRLSWPEDLVSAENVIDAAAGLSE